MPPATLMASLPAELVARVCRAFAASCCTPTCAEPSKTTSRATAPADMMADAFLGLRASVLSTPDACSITSSLPLESMGKSDGMAPAATIACRLTSLPIAKHRSTAAASSFTSLQSLPRSSTNGSMPPARAGRGVACGPFLFFMVSAKGSKKSMKAIPFKTAGYTYAAVSPALTIAARLTSCSARFLSTRAADTTDNWLPDCKRSISLDKITGIAEQ
mmetsp:Transcript_70865/g.117736  ORF Transcript_70865/g.117736 Transcript_70865/m.117736 type:complete len:217 (+) Transcript_70865:259-909(+)